MAELTEAQFEAAKQCGDTRLRAPRAIAARYDAGRGRVVIALSTGVELGLAPRDVEGLAGAATEDLKVIEIDSQGLGIHFPRLDADLYVPALLEGVLGSRRWMAARSSATSRDVRGSTEPAGSQQSARRSG